MVMDMSDYNRKITELLSDENKYKKVKKDSSTKILKTTTKLINKNK